MRTQWRKRAFRRHERVRTERKGGHDEIRALSAIAPGRASWPPAEAAAAGPQPGPPPGGNAPPGFTSAATVNVAENSTGTIYTATATDPGRQSTDLQPRRRRRSGALRDHRRRRALLRRRAGFRSADRCRQQQCLSGHPVGQRRHDERDPEPRRHRHQCRARRLPRDAGGDGVRSRRSSSRRCRTARGVSSSCSRPG